ncbi:hypothetical protein CRG98_048807 [Punica granatum]|uniref:Uncharacterized protein n=1 Tax=Punica granatum TaxID=22663 RepID=A0A2I0HGK2_PUNGR|nr:hypothetical protein CRG98_048807 [Punica granatum]
MLGCKGCTFGELGARGVRLECTGGARGARGQGQARGRAGVRSGRAACAGARAGARLAHGWHCSPESDDSSPEMH